MDLTDLAQLKIAFGIREATAFVGHSFADEDREVTERITTFLRKLGIVCDTGKRPEPRDVKDKIVQRIETAELFVGIFTRRDKKPGGKFATSPWVIEEKATAINLGKRLLLFVEEGCETEIGGLQGDYEYVRFSRNDLAAALIHAMDYVLAVTSIPLQCRVDPINRKIDLNLGLQGMSLDPQISRLRKEKSTNPNNVSARLGLAKLLGQTNRYAEAISELQDLTREHPRFADAHHELGHMQERNGMREEALLSFQNALDLNSGDYKNYRCYGKSLYSFAQQLREKGAKRTTLEKARRLLERAALLGGDARRAETSNDLFLVDEALGVARPLNTKLGRPKTKVAKRRGMKR